MKIRLVVLLGFGWLALTSCTRAPAPIAKGEILMVTLGDKPVMRAGEIGSWSSRTFSAGRVEIYDKVIVVTEPNGDKHCAPSDWFSIVRFK